MFKRRESSDDNEVMTVGLKANRYDWNVLEANESGMAIKQNRVIKREVSESRSSIGKLGCRKNTNLFLKGPMLSLPSLISPLCTAL